MKITTKTACIILWSGIFFLLLLVNVHVYYLNRLKRLVLVTQIEEETAPQKSNTATQVLITPTKTSDQVFDFAKKDNKIVKEVDQVSDLRKDDQKIVKEVKTEIKSGPPPAPATSYYDPKNNLITRSVSWTEFLAIPFDSKYLERETARQHHITNSINSYQPNICPKEMVEKLANPRLPKEEVDWCHWALSPSGGNAVVGKSWGNLGSRKDRDRFDSNNCNTVSQGSNPSCDDSWGDVHVKQWLKNPVDTFNCEKSKSSQVDCFKNANSDVYCEMKNAQINFRKVRKVSRGQGTTPSKKFEQDFMSTDCRSDVSHYSEFSFPHLYSPRLSSQTCDIVYNGTLLLYSHDDIRNLGHTLNDVMNVWMMLWLAGVARYGDQIDMLNIDSFKLGHNFDDEPNHFFLTYQKSLHQILKGIDFRDKTLCIKHLLIQNIPPRFFIWESWFIDLPCSFIGPSTLYQRWNLHVRAAYNLLSRPSNQYHNNEQKKMKILIIVRNEQSNMWGSHRTSRNYLNLGEARDGFAAYEKQHRDHIEIIFQEMNRLSFEEQLQLISDTSIMVGAHGAGMASSMHMSVGSKYCCGMIEMYPAGEFTPIKGHGNMARKMGIHYDRIDIGSAQSLSNGFHIPVPQLVKVVDKMVQRLRYEPSCIHPEVKQNPYLEIR